MMYLYLNIINRPLLVRFVRMKGQKKRNYKQQ